MMKARFLAAIFGAWLLGACTSDGHYSAQANDDLVQVIDATTEVLQAITTVVQAAH
jgi:hypothetical protein